LPGRAFPLGPSPFRKSSSIILDKPLDVTRHYKGNMTMTVDKSILRKSLAITLALALGVLPSGFAWSAGTVSRPVVTAPAAVPGVSGAVMSRVSMPSLSLAQGFAPTLSASLAPTLAPSANISAAEMTAPSALVPAAAYGRETAGIRAAGPTASAASIERHPVLGIIEGLRARGVELPETVTAADAMALAKALPEGSARAEMMGLAAALGNSGSGSGAATGRIFDGSQNRRAAGLDEAAAPVEQPSALRRWVVNPLLRLAGRADAPAPAARRHDKPANPQDYKVGLNELRWAPSDKDLPASTRDMKVADKQIVGQDDALKAMKFGLKMGITKDGRMDGRHYNMYVSGPEGSGRETALRHLLEDIAPKMQTPEDIVGLTNFENPNSPVFLLLAPGSGIKFAKAIKGFVAKASQVLPKALDQGEVGQMKKQIMAAIRADFENGIAAIQAAAKAVAMPEGYKLEFVVSHDEQGRTSFGTRVLYNDQPLEQGVETPKQQEALAKLQEHAPKFQEQFMAMAEKNNAMTEQAAQQIQQAEAQGAAQILSQLAQGLVAAVAPEQAASPELEAFQQKVAAWQEQFNAKVSAVDVEGFGIAVIPNGRGVAVAFTYEGQPVQKKTIEELLSSGKLSNAQWATIQDRLKLQAKTLMEEMKSKMAEFNAEAEKLQGAQPEMSMEQMKAMAYVQSLVRYAVSHYQIFLGRAAQQEDEGMGGLAALLGGGAGAKQADPQDHFRVSLITNNAKQKGAPVIEEKNPTVENLFGMADDNSRLGMMGLMPVRTEGVGGPSMKGGSFHRAHGGFLILNVMDLLRNPGSWQMLMRAVRNGQADIVEGGLMGLMRGNGASYGVPAKVKVILVGSPYLRMLLAHNDDDFTANFQSVAEFEPRVRIAEGTVGSYAQVLKNIVAVSGGEILDFSKGAIARVLEAMSRSAGDHSFLDASFGGMQRLAREASFWAREAGREEVRREDVETALKAKQDREETYRRHLIDVYKNNVFVVETSGKKVGQGNGLAVMGSFGVPMRVTAVVSRASGGGGLISVDRGAGSTGKSFNKALGVVEGFFNSLFASRLGFPAVISYSYEQNYGGIDGDSATSTEIYIGMSALAGVPLNQSIAYTGSADQFGNVQAIGGVNEKIEGFFELAKSRGLTGEQGVIIPRSNVRDLNLTPEVAQAVADGKFHIWAVDHVSQGIEILTGMAYSEVVERAEGTLKDMRRAGLREAAEAKKELGGQ
jgi:predicted ATP-dependent protease